MQHLAEGCESGAELMELNDGQIYQACAAVLRKRAPLPEQFFDNECARLTNLIRRWLDIESQLTTIHDRRRTRVSARASGPNLRATRCIDKVNNQAVVLD